MKANGTKDSAVDLGRRSAKSRKRRGRRPSLSNEESLDKVFEIFLEQGFERPSLDAISASVGIAKRTLYLRYGDKEALFRAALKRAIEGWILPIERLREAESDDLCETLISIGRLLVDNLLGPSGLRLLQLTNAVSGRMPEIGAYNVQLGVKPTIAYLAELLRQRIGPEMRCFLSTEQAALAFLNLVVAGPANLVAWGVPLDRQFVDQYLTSSVRLVVAGLVPSLREAQFAQLGTENQRLKLLLAETITRLDATRHKLAEAGDVSISS